MAIMEITEENFEQEVVKNKKPVMLDFWAAWCGPCQMQGPVIEQANDRYGEQMAFGKVNVDEQPDLAQKFGVMSIPTLVLLENGQMLKKEVGYRSIEEIGELIP